MRFLHTSDWHLGASDGNYSLLEDQKHFIDQICDIIQEQHVDAVLLAGDVYDTGLGSSEAIRLYDDAMSRICGKMGVSVLTVAGNHDNADRLASCRELLGRSGLHVQGVLQREPRVISLADADVYLIPWITEERVKNVFPEKKAEIEDLTGAYRVVCDSLRESFVPGKKHICIAHAYLTDAQISDSERAAAIGTAARVDAAVFAGFDYVALGHIHKPQDVNAWVRYSGTPMPYSFGREETQEKSVTILDTLDMHREIIPLPPLHRRTTCEGTLEELTMRPFAPEVVNGYVRLVVTDKVLGLEAQSALRSVFPHILEMEGKQYTDENGQITLTMQEFAELEHDPMQIFRRFCQERLNIEPTVHQEELFRAAVAMAEKEELA